MKRSPPIPFIPLARTPGRGCEAAAVVFVGAVGRRVRLVAEAYLGGEAFGLPEQTLMTGAGLSFGRWSLDLGIAVPFYETGSGTPGPIVTIGRAF